ncbi:MAG TPA: hypothetical protein VGS06_43230 [Streptosporangiaceae bacterium]|nr:hypothetical protein [Streptosporangiaceae bacterium]
MADRGGWLDAVESELRAVGRDLEVPPARDLTVVVRQRLEGRAVRRHHVPGLRTSALRRRPVWRAVLVVVAALLAALIATPQGRAVVNHVFRFAGIELRQGPGPVGSPVRSPSLPGERSTALEKARHRVSFPILVPTALGQPTQVVVSDAGRVVSLIYSRTPYGLVRMDEYAGHVDQIYFEKLVHFSAVTQVEVNGTTGLWIKGPHELLYVTRDGATDIASARLTTGNTLIWGTRQVALRLEGNLGKATALAIANSAH